MPSHTHTHTHTYALIHSHIHTHSRTHTYTHSHTHSLTHTHTHAHTQTNFMTWNSLSRWKTKAILELPIFSVCLLCSDTIVWHCLWLCVRKKSFVSCTLALFSNCLSQRVTLTLAIPSWLKVEVFLQLMKTHVTENNKLNITLRLNFAENVGSVEHNDKNLSSKPDRNWQVSLLVRD